MGGRQADLAGASGEGAGVMFVGIIKYWIVIPAILVTGFIAFQLHKIDVARLEAKQNKALAAQEKQLNEACDKAQQITKEVSHDYQEQLSNLGRKLDTLKRVHANTQCVPITGTAAGRDEPARAGEFSGPHGIRPDWLYDTAAEADKYRLQLIACQDFIKKERE